MRTLVAMLVALGLAASAVPAFAQDTPTDQASCEAEGMIWDADNEACYPAD